MGAAAALETVNMNPLGDWTTQEKHHAALFRALGSQTVKQRAGEGDREAQWSLGMRFMGEADGVGAPLGASGRSPEAKAGLAWHRSVSRSLTRMLTRYRSGRLNDQMETCAGANP